MKTDKNSKWTFVLIGAVIATAIMVMSLAGIGQTTENTVDSHDHNDEVIYEDMTEQMAEYVESGEVQLMSVNITLPGWESVSLPAESEKMAEGPFFYNPDANSWSEAYVMYKGQAYENLIVGGTYFRPIEHYATITGIAGNEYEITNYDDEYFRISEVNDLHFVSILKPFKGTKDLKVKINGKEEVFSFQCHDDFYYLEYSIYLEDGDKLVYQSEKVKPNETAKETKILEPLKEGSYNAYIYIQPYRSDGETKTNAGKMMTILNVN